MKKQKGATLIEILISLAIVMVGMAGMFRVLASSVQGSSSASKVSQAQFRAETILESIRTSPALGLACLTATKASDWGNCETLCRNALGVTADLTSCIYTVDAMKNLKAPDTNSKTAASSTEGVKNDRSNQVYYVVASGSGLTRDDSYVKIVGPNLRVYDAQVSIGWNDDSKATVTDSTKADHTVTLRTGVFR